MSEQTAQLLFPLFPAALLLVLGLVIRAHGPQGFVHGLVDWSKVNDETRQRAGRVVGDVLMLMAMLLLGSDAYAWLHPEDHARTHLVGLALHAGMILLMIGLVLYLARMQGKYKGDANRHGRR